MAVDADATEHTLSQSADEDEGVDVEPAESDDDDSDHLRDDVVDDPKPARSPMRVAALAGAVIVAVLAALFGYVGFTAHRAHQAADQRNLVVEVARQGAVNLTTIDWEHADADIQRILASATGQFHDDFAQRSQPFVDVVKQAKSKSVGTVTEAALESYSDAEAQVLVAVSVKTTNPAVAEASTRNWRMRIAVQKVGDDVKVDNVVFVP